MSTWNYSIDLGTHWIVHHEIQPRLNEKVARIAGFATPSAGS
jgi:hypothetical protein